jgi:nucleotide-binding universal stress UspA family protein
MTHGESNLHTAFIGTEAQRVSIPSNDDGPILIATDGSVNADPAFTAAALLASHTGAVVQVFSVVEPLPEHTADTEHAAFDLRERCELLREAVEAQVELTLGAMPDWPITILAGPLGTMSRQITSERNAQFVVVGRHRHSVFGRMVGADGAMHILEWASAPVYAASPDMQTVPTRTVVGIDFGVASIRAAHTLSRIIADDGTLYLVHVLPKLSPHRKLARKDMSMSDAQTALTALARSLHVASRVHVQAVVLFGVPARELLAFANGIGADLIACGTNAITPSRTHGNVLHTGSCAATLLSEASCSMLVAPAPAVHPYSSNNPSFTAS